MPDNKYFYKILDDAPPEPLPETLPATELDEKDQFIHLSVCQEHLCLNKERSLLTTYGH